MKKKAIKYNIIIVVLLVVVTALSGCSLSKDKMNNQQSNEKTNQVNMENQQNKDQTIKESNIQYKIFDTGASIISLGNEEKVLISNRTQLENILTENEEWSNANEIEELKKQCNKYDEEYFKNKSLAILVAAETAGVDFEVKSIKKNGNTIRIECETKDTRESDIYIQVMHGYVVVAEIDKGITGIEIVEKGK